MLIRISLIVAIIAGLAVGALNFVKIKEIITTLRTDLKTQTDLKEKALGDLSKAKTDLKKTQEVLATTQTELTNTIVARDKAIAEAGIQIKRATQLSDELAK